LKDNEKIARGRAVQDMMMTNGWKYVEEYLKKRIQQGRNSLVNGSFSDIGEVKSLQSEVLTCENILGKLDRWVEEAHRLEQGYHS